MTSEQTVFLTAILAGWAVLLQSVELLGLRSSYGPGGLWDWKIVGPEIRWLGFVMRPAPFTALLIVRSIAALILPFSASPAVPLFLALSTVLIAVRWRGSFNGGSDAMTLLLLLVLGACRLFGDQERMVQGALIYLAAQSLASYFLAGVYKFRSPSWRSGHALAMVAASPAYCVPVRLKALINQPGLGRLMSWAVIGFECCAPIVFLGRPFAIAFVAAAAAFHLLNAFALGLNRFFWAWIASFPAILFFAEALQKSRP